MWMVTRSPYVRLLSIYIEKVRCGENGCHHQYFEGFRRFRDRGNISFDEFVTIIYNDVLKQRNPLLVQPIQRVAELCHIDHHLCPQSACLFKLRNHPVRILKLEDQGSWFKDFAECFGVSREKIVGKSWRKFNNQSCFYTPTQDCNDALTVNSHANLTVDNVHGKGAVNQLNVFYTADSAAKVSYLYEYDFNVLNHSTWDGVSEYKD